MKKLFWALMAVAIFANFVIVGCAKNEEDEPLPPENSDAFVVTGVVKSAEDGAPLPGAIVIVQGTTQGTGTVADGSYRLTGVHYRDVLEFKYTGMKTQYITVTSTTINITMEVDALQAEEAVVTA